jgi:hypothetical protein
MDTQIIFDYIKLITDSPIKKASLIASTGVLLYLIKKKFSKIQEDIEIDEKALKLKVRKYITINICIGARTC